MIPDLSIVATNINALWSSASLPRGVKLAVVRAVDLRCTVRGVARARGPRITGRQATSTLQPETPDTHAAECRRCSAVSRVFLFLVSALVALLLMAP